MARYRLTASSAARNQRAVLIDAVEVGSIGLCELRDAPEHRVLLHIRGYHVAIVDQQEAETNRLQFPCDGVSQAGRELGLDDLRGVREGNPSPRVHQDFHLEMSVPGRVALQYHLVDALGGTELHLNAGVGCDSFPGGPPRG